MGFRKWLSFLSSLGNIVSGRHGVFNERFPPAMHRILDAIKSLPPPEDSIQRSFLKTYRCFVQNTMGFLGQLVYPPPDGKGLIRVEEVKRLSVDEAYALYWMLLSAFVHLSLEGSRKFASQFRSLVELTAPHSLKASIVRVNQQMVNASPQQIENGFISSLATFFPRVEVDPILRMQVVVVAYIWAGINNEMFQSEIGAV